MDTKNFIKHAIDIHGTVYDYDLTRFIDWKTPLTIICKQHGFFNQWPYPHLHGAGCRRCKGQIAQESERLIAAKTFIERAIQKHGYKYQYSKTIYKSSKDNVTITCLVHGDFEQKASNHLMGKGCRKCALQSRKEIRNDSLSQLQEEFIKKSSLVHKCFYSYEKVVYIKAGLKVEIICPIHGSFFQSPHLHSLGAGCKACADKAKGIKKRLQAAEEFEERARKVHGSKYDYPNVLYENSAKKIEVFCPRHGPFKIIPNAFLRGVGCNKCGVESMASKQATGITEFIQRAAALHENKYDYSHVVYKSSHEYVKIICPIHGLFTQVPSAHLAGRGCSLCGFIQSANSTRNSLDDFIKDAKKIHGKKYDYSQAIYSNSSLKLTIICPTHGPFKQTPGHHIHSTQGCPACANRDMDLEKFIKRAYQIHGNKFDYSEGIYLGARKFIRIICAIHGPFNQRAYNHLNGRGCVLCVDAMNSKGVRKIETWLNKNNVLFEREKSFPDLVSAKRGNKSLRFDFYLPTLKVLIEFDGEQHFKANMHWGGEKAFLELVANDKKKNDWAKSNGYQMIRISFSEESQAEKILLENLIKQSPLKSRCP